MQRMEEKRLFWNLLVNPDALFSPVSLQRRNALVVFISTKHSDPYTAISDIKFRKSYSMGFSVYYWRWRSFNSWSHAWIITINFEFHRRLLSQNKSNFLLFFSYIYLTPKKKKKIVVLHPLDFYITIWVYCSLAYFGSFIPRGDVSEAVLTARINSRHSSCSCVSIHSPQPMATYFFGSIWTAEANTQWSNCLPTCGNCTCCGCMGGFFVLLV